MEIMRTLSRLDGFNEYLRSLSTIDGVRTFLHLESLLIAPGLSSPLLQHMSFDVLMHSGLTHHHHRFRMK